MQPDGSTPIPATNRKLPHIVVENDASRALSVLSVIRQHDYIQSSPAHTKSFTLSQRGYVEYNKKGLSEFCSLKELGRNLHQYSLAHKHAVFGKFREYKTFRRWDYVVRRRKFRSKKAIMEKLMLQSNRENWAVVQQVVVECVALQKEVAEEDLKPISTGITLEQLSAEIQRRREILQEALEGARQRISDMLTAYFSTVSGKNKVERLRDIFMHNRRGEIEKAEDLAAQDMRMLSRIYCLSEHIVSQTAAMLYNDELHRILRFFQTESQGILQVEAHYHVDPQAIISLKLPYSEEDKAQAEQATELLITPSGAQIEETLIKDLQSIYLTLSYTMRPILVPNLASFVVDELLSVYLPRKPEFVSLVTKSRDAIQGHERLIFVLKASDKAAMQHTQQTMGHLRMLVAYVEAFLSTPEEELRKSIHSYPSEVQQLSSWFSALNKLAAHDADLGAFRLKYRKVKTHVQEKLQTKVIDQRFKAFQEMVVETIAGIKLMGSKYTKDLEVIAHNFSDLKLLLGTMEELNTGIVKFTSSIQEAIAMRDVLVQQYRTTSAWIETNESGQYAAGVGTSVQSKLHLPNLSSNLAENVKNQVQNTKVRLMNQRETHIKIVREEIDKFTAQVVSYQQQMKSSSLQDFGADAREALDALAKMKEEVAEFDHKVKTIDMVLKQLVLPPLNTAIVTEAHETLESLIAIWEGIQLWKELYTLVMSTPLPTLQEMDLVTKVSTASSTVSEIVQRYSGFPVAQALQMEFREFEALWPMIKMATDPAMKKPHYDALFQGSGKDKTDLVHVDLQKTTVTDLVRRNLLSDVSRLRQLHEMAVQEDQVFVLMDRLRASTENINVVVKEHEDLMWLEGIEDAVAECQDNSLLIEWIRQGPFANMTSRDIMKFKTRNQEALHMLHQLKYCQDSWNTLRALKNLDDCLSINDLGDVRTALYKWIKCIIALSRDMGVIELQSIDYPQVLRVQEVVEEMGQIYQIFQPAYDSLCQDCHRFNFVQPKDALLVASQFCSEGPTIDPNVISKCFPNIFAVKFNGRHVAMEVWGANKELVELPDDKKETWQLRRELKNFTTGLKEAIRRDILTCLVELRARQGFQGEEWKTNHRVQTLMIALAIRWSETLRGDGQKAASDADLQSRVVRAREMVMRFLVGGAEKGASQDLSLATRRKESSLMLLSLHWRDVLDTTSHPQQPKGETSWSSDHCSRGLFLYSLQGSTLTVNFGPMTTQYGFAFSDGTHRVVCPPKSWKLALYLIACMRSCTCGVVEETSRGSAGAEGPGGGAMSLMRHVAQACGQHLHVVECDQQPPKQELLRLPAALASNGCNTWLCIRDPHFLDPKSTITLLAQQILSTLSALAVKNAATNPLPCITFMSSPSLPTAISQTVPLGPYLPLDMRDTLRPFLADSPDSRFLLEVLFQAAHFPSPVDIARQLDKAFSIVSLGIRPLETFFLSPSSLRAVVDAAESIAHEAGVQLAPLASLHHPHTRTGRERARRSSLPETGEDKDEHHAFYAATASAFLAHGRRLLSDCSYESCKWAVFFAFGPMGVEVQSVESHWDALFASKVQFVMQAKNLKATDKMVSNCVSLYRALRDERRPVILHGPAQTAKSKCLEVVRLARYVDLNNPGKEALTRTFSKKVAPLAYFSYTDQETGVEELGTKGKRELREYVEWFSGSLIQSTFIYLDRWLVLDVPEASSVDAMVYSIWQNQQSARPFLPRHTMRPAVMLETSSIANSSPSALASSHLIAFEENPLGWEQIYHNFLEQIRSQLEPRTLQELQSLASAHLPDVEAFVAKECRLALPMSRAAVSRTLCSIIHYHFFLGRDTATRRTVVFARATFVFAIAWSWGAALDEASKKRFDPWLQERMRKAKIASFVQPNRGEVVTPLWEYYVSFKTMNLRPFAETAEAFVTEERAHRAAEQVLIVPTEQMRMHRLLWTIFRTQEENILYHGEAGGGKTKLLEWLFAQHHGYETQFLYTQFPLKRSSTAQTLREFIGKQQAKLQEKTEGGNLVLMIDDMHLPLEDAHARGRGTGCPISELLRTFMERRMLLVKSDLQDDKILKSAVTVASGVTRHLEKVDSRLLGHFSTIPVHGGDSALYMSIAKVIGGSFLDGTGVHSTVRAAMERLPHAITAVFEWSKLNLAPASMHELLLRWDAEHLRTVLASLSFINWRVQHDLEFPLRYVWHEMMRVFCDRMGNVTKISAFRIQAQQMLAKHIGSKMNRSIRLAVESKTYHVMFPPTEAPDASPGAKPASWDQDWTMHEMQAEALQQKGIDIAMQEPGNLWHAGCITGFGRHLSHVLRVLRPYTWVQSCILYGPISSGRQSVLMIAAKMVGYKVQMEGPDKSAAHCLSDLHAALYDKQPTLFVFRTQGPLLDAAVRERVECLITGRTLDKWEHQHSLSIRFAFCVDLGPSAAPTHRASPRLPPQLDFVARFSSVDWYEGWSDPAILRMIQKQISISLAAQEFLTKEEISAIQQRTPHHLYRVHNAIEKVADDASGPAEPGFFPNPKQAAAFAKLFVEAYVDRLIKIRARTTDLEHAIERWTELNDKFILMENQQEEFEPILRTAVETQLKWRADTLHFERVANRARKIAESDEINGMMSVLYGDAPGYDIHKEFQHAQRQLMAAFKNVADMKKVHFMQLEMCDVNAWPELLGMLQETICICFAEQIGEDSPSLKEMAPDLQERIAHLDVNKIGLVTINRLRSYISDTRFIPEKLFAINRAAGVLCYWVRSVERYARANEWMKPDSSSNQNQSLDRVREMSRKQIMAVQEVDTGVQAAKTRHAEAIRREASTREDMAKLQRELQDARVLLGSLTPDFTQWQLAKKDLVEISDRHLGDTILFAASVSYLGFFKHEQRLLVLQTVAEVLAAHLHATLDSDPDDPTLVEGVQCTPGFSLERHLDLHRTMEGLPTVEMTESRCFREGVLHVVMLYQQQRIPLIIDPVGKALVWLEDTLQDRLRLFVRGGTGELIQCLRAAKEEGCPVVLKHADLLAPRIIEAFFVDPTLIPRRKSEVVPFSEATYSVFLVTTCKQLELGPTELALFSVVDLTPDEDWLQEIAFESTMSCLMPDAHKDWTAAREEGLQIKRRIEKLAEGLRQTFCSIDIVAEVGRGGEMVQHVNQCKELSSTRGTLQNHVVESMELMRETEHLRGVSTRCCRVLASFWTLCAASRSNLFALPLFHRVLRQCSSNLSLQELQPGSVAFRHGLQNFAKAVMECTGRWATMAVDPAMHDMFRVLLVAAQDNEEVENGFRGLQLQAATMMEHRILAMKSYDLAVRGVGPCGVFSAVGWQCLRAVRDILGETYQAVLESIEERPEEWMEIASRPGLPSRLPEMGAREPLESHKLLIACALSPFKLKSVVAQLALKHCEHPTRQGLLDCGSLVTDSAPDTPLLVLPSNDLPSHNAVLRLLFTVRQALQAGKEAPGRNVCVVPVGAGEEDMIASVQQAKESQAWLLVEEEGQMVETGSRSLMDEMQASELPASFRCWMTARAASASLRGNLHNSRMVEHLVRSSIASESMGLAVQDTDDPRELLLAVVADCWARQAHVPAVRLRTLVGMCYWHAALRREQGTAASSLFYWAPQVTVQQLLLAARALVACEGKPADEQRVAVAIVRDAAYAPVFHRPQSTEHHGEEDWRSEGVAEELVEGIFGHGLYRDREQLLVLDVMMDAPDPLAGQWPRLWGYCSGMNPSFSMSWAQHRGMSEPLQIEEALTQSQRVVQALNDSMRHPPKQEPMAEVVQLFEDLRKAVPPKLPADAAREVLRQQEAALEETNTEAGDEDTSALYKRGVLEEADQVNKTIDVVMADMSHLGTALLGRRVLDIAALELYEHLRDTTVPASWDRNRMRLRKPLPAWMESLRERAAWFGGQLASLKLTQNIRIPLPIVPLALYSMPHQYLRTLLLADAIRNPGRVGRDMKFLVTPAQTTEDSLRGSPLYEGGTVKGIIFRCSYLEPSTGVLHELQSGPSSVTRAGDLQLQPMDQKRLPQRASMKKACQHWCTITLFRYPPSCINPAHAPTDVEPLCELIVRSSFHSSRATSGGVFAYLSYD